MTNLTLPIFTDAEAARAHLEALLWPSGTPSCPHCGVVGENTLVKGKSHRPGMYMCNACRKPFSVTVGTVMEKSHIPLNKWVLGFHLMASSKKGISAHQLHRQLGITYKAAWFMAHRIREAMTSSDTAPMGGNGGVVEGDEVYIGRKDGMAKKGGGLGHKNAVVSLVERGGKVRSFHVGRADKKTVGPIIRKNVSHEARFYTDESKLYRGAEQFFAIHETVNHRMKEYARGDVTTNTVEGFFSVFKRGMVGPTSTAANSTCSAIWPSLISGRATARRLASMTPCARSLRSKALPASG
jgi:transposase-like protein